MAFSLGTKDRLENNFPRWYKAVAGNELAFFWQDAMTATFPYPSDVECVMKTLYRTLRENDRRRYAAVEAAKLGHGGTEYISRLLDCEPKTVRHGEADLRQLQEQPVDELGPTDRVRKKGVAAGRS
jgi:hypothetical protein